MRSGVAVDAVHVVDFQSGSSRVNSDQLVDTPMILLEREVAYEQLIHQWEMPQVGV